MIIFDLLVKLFTDARWILHSSSWFFFCFLLFTQIQGFEQVGRLPNTQIEWINLVFVFLLTFIPVLRFLLRRIL
ncbi:hypothetical protein DR996_30820 [Vibrio owensii]|nr:hypothetical protein DR996_30820 [Vibrio owensii]